MRVLVAYATKKGATEDMAARIARGVGDADIVDLRGPGAASADLSRYGAVVIGAPSYMGSWHKAASAWAASREAELSGKTLAFFELGTALGQVSARAALPTLCGRAVAVAKLGGEVRWKRLSLLERLATKAVTGKGGDSSSIDEKAVEAFIQTVKEAIR